IKRRLKDTLELESGSNDPMAFFLVTIFLELQIQPGANISYYFSALFINPIVGFLGGYCFFRLFRYINIHLELEFQGLYPALTIGFLFLTYSSTAMLKGNGLLAVYVLGLFLGNHKIMHKKSLLNYMDGTSWLFQIGLFILL